MSIDVKLSQELVESAQRLALAQYRSTAQQIEHWARIGKVVEDNPELPFSIIRKHQITSFFLKNGKIYLVPKLVKISSTSSISV
jgi:ParD-like antitoxin of type II bacterial toxin-antitoxin system